MNVQRFGFDRVFRFPTSADDKPRDDGPLRQQIAAMEAEIDRLRTEHMAELTHARCDGFAAGLAQARSERETALLAATDAVQAGLEELVEQFALAEAMQRKDMASLAFTAAEVLAGHEVNRSPARAVDEALGRLLTQVARGTALAIRVHPDMAEDMEALLAARRAGERRRLDITIIADPAIAPGDGAIFWEEGGLLVDAASRRRAIMAELLPLLTSDPDNSGKTDEPGQ